MRFRLPWRPSSLLAVLSIVAIAGSAGPASADTNDDIHISAVGEFYVLHKYSRMKSHKAIAVGPFGYWDAYYGMRSASAAAKTAVATCNQRLRADKSRDMRGKKCVLFDVNGKRTGKASPIGVPFGTPASGEDNPLLFGKVWAATSPLKRGIMLLLHGCDGYAINAWQMAWVNYYRAAGFRVIMPNSFADVRDPATCGVQKELVGFERQTRNLKLRVAQTLRTVAGIRRKYPGEALYLHGHSEGGWVAQALGEKLGGIILTGTACGFGDSLAYVVAKGVPILHIAGTKDHAFIEAKSAKAFERYCQRVTGAGKVTRVAVAGMDHYAAIWWPEVQDAIDKFLKIPPVRIRRPAGEGVAYPNIPSRDAQAYQQGRQHKAIAAHKDGNNWAWIVESGSRLDAEETALFDCDLSAGEDVYLDSSHMHGCVLVDVNGKRLIKIEQ